MSEMSNHSARPNDHLLEEIRADMAEFYTKWIENEVAPLVGGISPETVAATVEKLLAREEVKGLIESTAARLTGGLQ